MGRKKENGEKENKGMMVAGTGANAFLWRKRDGEKKRTLPGGGREYLIYRE